MVKSQGSGMASRAVDHPPQQARVVGGGGKPKKNSLADGRNRRALKETGNLPNIRGTEPNPCRRITRSYRAQLKAQAAEAADIIDLESSEDELRQAEQSSFGFGKVVHQTAHFHVIDLDSSEDEQSQAVKSKFASGGVAQSAEQIDVIELESSEDEQSPKESVGDHDPKCSVSMEETLLIPQSSEVESTITTEAYEVENLQAQNEMTTSVELESVTLEPLHADSLTDALTEQVWVHEHYVCDCSDHGTGGRTEYVVCGHTIGSVSDIAAFEEKDQLEIGAADSIGEVEETLLIPQSNEVESTITTEAYEVENLQAQNEMTTRMELESVTLEPLHADSLTDALTEQVRVDKHYVCDCSDHGTGGRTEYVVCGHIGSVSDIAAFEEKQQLEIGAADSIGEVEVDLEYEEVDQQAEAPVDIKDLDMKGQLEIGAVGNIVEVDLDQEYEKLCEHLQAQSEISSGAEVEFVTLGALHWDNMSASKEGVSVDGYPVFDYSDNGTMSDYEVFGNTMGSISDVASFEEKDQPEIEAADDIGEIVVDLKYKVDEEAEAKVDNDEALEVHQGLPETESKVSMVNVIVLSIMISALISVLIGSTAFSYVKKGSSTLNLAISMCQQSLPNKQLNASPDVACNTAHIFQHIPSSWNWIKAPWHSKLSSFQKSSSYRLIGLQASTEDEVQEKRGATDSVCQQPLLTKNLSASSMPASTTQNFHFEMKSLQNSSFYQTQGLNESYEAERQEKGGSERTFEESPWLQLTPQWDYSYGSFTTTEKSIIKNGHADDELISPQWARHLYGSFTTQETYPIKNRHRDDEEAVTPQPYHLYGNFTTDSNQECAAVTWR
ncbi:uncharacterized protein LOC133738065 [Rosa rugosa]|uniref:uncharacterized protein LOC133738065 n=1 Tax=Rosa rugosa TaxID=74645 RepID=UPI002B40A53C|nr:uncharacterized protein LOC133738065 [Rosa rugosa]